jgi:phytoene dehydrogenase-like protein
VVVVGGGWGGLGSSKALAKAGFKVTILDALPDPSGNTPFQTPT